VRLFPALFDLFGVMLFVFSLFALVGMFCFGGVIHDGQLPDTDFDKNDYYTLNFNDFGSSMVTLFALTIVSNWSVIMDGYVDATGTEWSRLVKFTSSSFLSLLLTSLSLCSISSFTGLSFRRLLSTF
jgi:hypothetical protein